MGDPEAILAASSDATARDRVLAAAGKGIPMQEPSSQLDALLRACQALDRAQIPYALISGLAVSIHASMPRATQDIDVAVVTSVMPGQLDECLAGAGFSKLGEQEHSINFRDEHGEPLQVARDPSFDPMIGRATTVIVSGTTISVVARDDLIAMKRRAAADPARRKSKALQDRADLERLAGDVEGEDEGW